MDFDLIEFWEDMASKNGCAGLPRHLPGIHGSALPRVAEFARHHGIEVILVDCDGNIEGSTGLMLEAG